MKRSHYRSLALAGMITVSAIGCGKKASQDAAAVDSARAANVAEKAKDVATTSTQSEKPAGPAISSKTLTNFLPNLSGFTANEPQHTDLNMNGMSWSSAERSYDKGDTHVKVTIFDYNNNMQLAAVYNQMRNFSVETDKEITKGETINGNPGWVNWNKENKSGTVGVILNDRVYVIVEGNAASLDDLKSMLGQMDLSGLSKAS